VKVLKAIDLLFDLVFMLIIMGLILTLCGKSIGNMVEVWMSKHLDCTLEVCMVM